MTFSWLHVFYLLGTQFKVVKPDCIVSQLFVLSFHFFHLMSHNAEALHTNSCKNSIVEQAYSFPHKTQMKREKVR